MITHKQVPRVEYVRVPAAELERLQKRVGELEVLNARQRGTVLEVQQNFAACSDSNKAFCEDLAELRASLRDAMAFFDRVSGSQTNWTAADVQTNWTAADVARLAEIRKLVTP